MLSKTGSECYCKWKEHILSWALVFCILCHFPFSPCKVSTVPVLLMQIPTQSTHWAGFNEHFNELLKIQDCIWNANKNACHFIPQTVKDCLIDHVIKEWKDLEGTSCNSLLGLFPAGTSWQANLSMWPFTQMTKEVFHISKPKPVIFDLTVFRLNLKVNI